LLVTFKVVSLRSPSRASAFVLPLCGVRGAEDVVRAELLDFLSGAFEKFVAIGELAGVKK
jgi:hypothetical protein